MSAGTFCWADLGTPDARAAKRFYTDLFGWQAEDRPVGAEAYYTMFSVGGRWVAALYQQDAQPDQASPHWLSYLSVAGAGPMAQRARDLGGTVVDEAFDVLDVGRMAVIRDPTGAAVLFDGGVPEARVDRTLRRLGVRRLSVVVATHNVFPRCEARTLIVTANRTHPRRHLVRHGHPLNLPSRVPTWGAPLQESESR